MSFLTTFPVEPVEFNLDPLVVWDTMWTQMALHYPFFCLRGVNWDAVNAEFRPQITPETNSSELFALITSALSLLDDAHLLLIAVDPVSKSLEWNDELKLILP